MKNLSSLALVALVSLVGCDGASRLDKTTKVAPGTAAPTGAPLERSGTLEERVARLEDNFEKYREPLDFLGKVYAQQKAQQQAQEREEPAPDAVFAVDIKENVALGMVEGPRQAQVTIVEAWDFA